MSLFVDLMVAEKSSFIISTFTMKSSNRKPREKVLTLITLGLLLVNAGAILIYFHFATYFPANILLRNYFLNIWICLVLSYLMLESLCQQCQNPTEKLSKTRIILRNAYFLVMGIIFLEIAVSWDVYGRADLASLASTCVAFCIFNIYLVSSRNAKQRKAEIVPIRKAKRPSKTQVQPLTESAPLISTSESSEGSVIEIEQQIALERIKTRRQKLLSIASNANVAVKVLVFILSCFLLNGAVLHGVGTQDFPPIDGHFVQMNTTHAGHRVYYRCTSNTSNLTTVFFLGNYDQSMADFLGIFDLNFNNNSNELFRVCVWDPPGLGYSDYSEPETRIETLNDVLFFLQHLNNGTSSPFFLVGFEHGGSMARAVAAKAPDMVSQLLLIDSLKPRFHERMARLALEHQNSSATIIQAMMDNALIMDYRALQFQNGFMVPFGLAQLAQSPKPTSAWLKESAREQRWCEVTERSWIRSLYDRIRPLDMPLELNMTSTGSGVRTSVALIEWSEAKIDSDVCKPNKLSPDTCQLWKANAAAATKEKVAMLANDGQIFICQDCSRNKFLFEDPSFTLDIIKQLITTEQP